MYSPARLIWHKMCFEYCFRAIKFNISLTGRADCLPQSLVRRHGNFQCRKKIFLREISNASAGQILSLGHNYPYSKRRRVNKKCHKWYVSLMKPIHCICNFSSLPGCEQSRDVGSMLLNGLRNCEDLFTEDKRSQSWRCRFRGSASTLAWKLFKTF